jgi:predicted nuclease of predicted toxin-antitoxin system
VKLLADAHISPVTVLFLRRLQHDAVRVGEVLYPSASDENIITYAVGEDRAVLTQDLDFSAIMALSGRSKPSVITLRLASSRVEYVNTLLEKVLPRIEAEVLAGSLITVADHAIRYRSLPLG